MKSLNFSKNNLPIIVLVVTYFLIVLCFWPPYPKRHNIHGCSYSKAAQENTLSKTLYILRKPFVKSGQIAIAVGCGLLILQNSFLKLAVKTEKIKQAKRVVILSLTIWGFAAFAELFLAILSLVITKTAKGNALKEFSRLDFLLSVGVGFCAIACLISDIPWLKYLFFIKQQEQS